MKKKILVIDDEEIICRTIVIALEKQGHEVYVVKSGNDALAITDAEDFDLIISDIRMPGRDGVEVVKEITEKIKEKKQHIPVIFMTGYAEKEFERRAKELNPAGFFFKPFDLPNFLKAIQNALVEGKSHGNS